MTGRVLIATGGLITGKERSILLAARKWWEQWREAEEAWLDFKVKLVMAEPLLAARLEGLCSPENPANPEDSEPPSLTEVVLATLLHQAGVPYETMEIDEVFSDPEEVDRKLAETDCVFLSSTYLHDLSEVEPLLRRLKRPHNRIVMGGALAGILHDRWEGAPELDVLAVGYGELLIESLAAWIRSGFKTLEPPDGGRLVSKGKTTFLYSGVPRDLSLDFLPPRTGASPDLSEGSTTRASEAVPIAATSATIPTSSTTPSSAPKVPRKLPRTGSITSVISESRPSPALIPSSPCPRPACASSAVSCSNET